MGMKSIFPRVILLVLHLSIASISHAGVNECVQAVKADSVALQAPALPNSAALSFADFSRADAVAAQNFLVAFSNRNLDANKLAKSNVVSGFANLGKNGLSSPVMVLMLDAQNSIPSYGDVFVYDILKRKWITREVGQSLDLVLELVDGRKIHQIYDSGEDEGFLIVGRNDDPEIKSQQVISSIEQTVAVSLKSGSAQMSTGDQVTLRSKNGKMARVVFLGGDSRSEYFFEPKSGKIVAVELTAIGSLSNGNVSGVEKVPLLLETEMQTDETCAVHSVVNCISFLDRIGKLINPSLSSSVRHQRSVLFKEVWQITSSEAYERDIKGKSWLGQRLVPRQSLRQQAYFIWKRIPANSTFSARKLVAHLRGGNPAIMNLTVKYGTQVVTRFTDDKETQRKNLVPSIKDGQALGSHSVLALGIVRSGWFRNKVLVLDSATGSFALWDISEIKKANAEYVLVKDKS